MNKHNPSKKTLVLHRERLRHLTTATLVGVHGGMINQSRLTECECPTAFCTSDLTISRTGTSCTQP